MRVPLHKAGDINMDTTTSYQWVAFTIKGRDVLWLEESPWWPIAEVEGEKKGLWTVIACTYLLEKPDVAARLKAGSRGHSAHAGIQGTTISEFFRTSTCDQRANLMNTFPRFFACLACRMDSYIGQGQIEGSVITNMESSCTTFTSP